ncbi:hypothetical protein GR702_14680 [Novosphingobium sp. FGD1]|uniref:VOC domain-containing protein n=1 Tax=Novosphingobium silvae TaxID=2692619 RepID=A0A7X4K898_9SPHN|nr:hypothetical protein [Novosphingobium silvae]MYL99010.1 hypothetical protein [Novosphingobium silvae]
MIYHVSIDARDPRHVAEVLAELMGGHATPFPPIAEGSWLAHAGDDRNTMVEVYPRGTQLVEATGDADALGVPGEGGLSATHFAMATRRSQAEIFAIATREGWPAKYRKRGGAFGVVELWIEGNRMVEVLTEQMQREYLDTMRLDAWQAMLAQGGDGQRVAA